MPLPYTITSRSPSGTRTPALLQHHLAIRRRCHHLSGSGYILGNRGFLSASPLTLDPDYDQSQPIVKANGTEATPDAKRQYTVSSIYEDITITIEGVTENTPTGNAEVEENDVKVWAADGQTPFLSVPSTRVWIYAFNGNLIRSLDEVAGDITVNLNKGSYIIVVGEKRYKVAL